MPPKRKHSAKTTIRPSKRIKKSIQDRYYEQDIDDQSGRLGAFNAGTWPPSSSYSDAPNLHDDDTSQYSNVTTTLTRSSRRSSRLKFISQESALASLDLAIDESTDLSKPLTATRSALHTVLRVVQGNTNIRDPVWSGLTKTLKFHLDTLNNQLDKLDEDKEIDTSALPFDPAIKELLRSYASKLVDIHDLTRKKKSGPQNTAGVIEERLRDFDEAFNQYTRELHRFVASTVDHMREDLLQVDRAFLQKALSTNPSHIKTINAYGVQHGQCRPGTRIKTLGVIRRWIDDVDSPNWIFCLLDFAGSGKSTISKHMDREWKKDLRFMARFFFSRDTAETMSIERFCPIVADAFASQDGRFNNLMEQFQKRRDYKLLSFEEQFEGLIVDPLKAINRPAILIIDALDECDNEHGHRDELLNIVSNQLLTIPYLRVFVTGRPERDIKQWATTTAGVHCTNFLQLEGDNDDVGNYIKERLSDLPFSLQEKVSRVVENAEGVFIWARIACDLLCKTVNKQALLDSLGKEVTLDYLYTIALEQSIPKDGHSRQAAVMVLEMILSMQSPLSILQLAQLSLNPDAVEAVVTSLGSILLYKDRKDPIRLIHATLREFLTSATKAGPWFVQLGLGHYNLAAACIDILTGVKREEPGQGSNTMDDTFRRQELSSKRKEQLLIVYLVSLNTHGSRGGITVEIQIASWV
ncbi:hypothetical protein FRB91_008469 [Serendipita sp. 411]|nr:hypothetical protein FRB91_008469 [Serendipita sp. 411]